jgi:biotin transporter BioY
MEAMRPGPCFLVVRAAVFAAVCVALGASGHDLMSATLVPGWALVLAGLAVFGGALLLGRRERSLATITATMLAIQLASHELFTHTQPAAPAMAGMTMPTGSAGGMLVVHLVAAAVCAWWLRQGEAAAWSLLLLLDQCAVAPLRAALALVLVLLRGTARRVRRPASYAPVLGARSAPLRHSVSRRGPPVAPLPAR